MAQSVAEEYLAMPQGISLYVGIVMGQPYKALLFDVSTEEISYVPLRSNATLLVSSFSWFHLLWSIMGKLRNFGVLDCTTSRDSIALGIKYAAHAVLFLS